MAGDVTVDFRLDRDFEPRMRGISDAAMRASALFVLEQMKRRIPKSHDGAEGRPPGYAASRLRIRVRIDGGGASYDVGTDATSPDGYPYPVGLEYGTRPHVIRSHGNYPLRNRRTGQVFGRVVQHPGTRAQPWARPSLEALRGRTF